MYVRTVEFSSLPMSSLEKAGPLFRIIVGVIHPLNHSLLGRKPLCEKQLELDLETHQEVRKFKDEASLLAFCKYLDEVLAKADDGEPVAEVRAVLDSKGAVQALLYGTVNGRARILLRKNGAGDWLITGTATFKYPIPVLHALNARALREQYGLVAVARDPRWVEEAAA